MDIATVIGFVGTMGLIYWSMDNAAGIDAFIDPTSVVIVFVGSIMVLLMRSTLPEFINAWAKVLAKTILNKNENAGEIIGQLVSMANISRRDGVIALEGQMGEIENQFLQTGIGMVVDGTDAELLEAKLTNGNGAYGSPPRIILGGLQIVERYRSCYGNDWDARWLGGNASKHVRPESNWSRNGHRAAHHSLWRTNSERNRRSFGGKAR